MRRRITCWPTLPPQTWLRLPHDALPFPAQEPGTRLYAFARQGLQQGVVALGMRPRDEVLVPAYHHGSEVAALLGAGLQCRFYGGGNGVHPVEEELEALLTPRVRALHLTHALGFPQEAARWRSWCDRHGLLLIEDAAQAWLAWDAGRPVGALGDLSVFCAYKSAPIPEGAFALARGRSLPAPSRNDSLGASDLARRHGGWLTQRSGFASAAVQLLQLERTVDAASDLALREQETGPWRTTLALLRRLDLEGVAAVRRAHYRLLLESTGGSVPDAFTEMPEGASPFVLPLLVEDKPAQLDRLRQAGVWALDLWSRPHPMLEHGRFPVVDELRRSVVGLPVHQGLRPVDLEAVTAAVRPRGSRPRAHVELLTDLSAAEPAWRRLSQTCPNPFASWEWAEAWQQHGDGGDALIGLCRAPDGREAALVPLQRHQLAGVRALRFWGSPAADLSGPVCAPHDDLVAAQGVRALLQASTEWQVLLGERLPATTAWPALLGAAAVRREPSPVLVLGDAGWEGFLAGRSRNFRQQVRRYERRLLQRGATYRLATAESLDQDLETLFRLHTLRWPGGSEFLARRAFHSDFARRAAARGWLRLWVLEIDGHAVAAWYGLRYAGQDWYYQAGRDPAWDEMHAGAVLLAHTVRDAASAGVSAYRFLRGGESYKWRYTSYDPGTQGLVLGRRGAGVLAARGVRLAGALPEPARGSLRALVSGSGRTP